ncbi:MAG TPA: hypothetical protein VHD90_20900 [Phototrophicaceae bacterium]|nr:hypothetical protein [Phototrophicaceae bacterium]
MTNNPLILAGLVGLALVCGGLFIGAFIFLFRFAGEHSIEFFSFLAHESREENGKDDDLVRTSRRPDLRSIAAAQDFDSALAKHAIQNEIEPQAARPTSPVAYNPPATPTVMPNAAPPFPDAQPRLGSRGRNRQARTLTHEDNGDGLSDLLDDSAED